MDEVHFATPAYIAKVLRTKNVDRIAKKLRNSKLESVEGRYEVRKALRVFRQKASKKGSVTLLKC